MTIFERKVWSRTINQRPAANRPTAIIPLRLTVTSQADSDVSTSKSGALSDMSASDGEALGDASSPESGARTPTVVQTAARKVEAHMSVPGDGEELREGRGRAQTRRSTGEPPWGWSVRSSPAKKALYVR